MLKNLIYLLAALLLAIYFVLALRIFPQCRQETICQQINISISGDDRAAKMLSSEAIKKQINSIDSLPLHKPFLMFDAFRVESQLKMRNALVDGCDIFHTLDGSLHINIHRTIPLFMLLTPKGSYYVTQQGTKIACGNDRAVLPIPVVYGEVGDVNAEKTLTQMVKHVAQDSLWSTLFTDFYIDAEGNLYLSGPIKGCNVLFGKKRELFAEQLACLRVFIAKGLPKFGWDAFKQLSLIVPGQVIATPSEHYHTEDLETKTEIPKTQ